MPERAVSYRNHSSTAKPVKPRNQTVKVGAPQGTGQTCSCMDLVLMEFGFSLWGIHCRNSLCIFISLLPVCVVWAAGHSWSQQSDGHMDTRVSWAGCPRHCAGTLEQSLIILCNFCFSRLQDSLCGVGVCCIPEGLFCSFSARVTLVVAEAIGKCGWAGVFLRVGHWVKSSEQCLLSNGTFRWDELLVIRLIWGLLYAKPFPAPSLLCL